MHLDLGPCAFLAIDNCVEPGSEIPRRNAITFDFSILFQGKLPSQGAAFRQGSVLGYRAIA